MADNPEQDTVLMTREDISFKIRNMLGEALMVDAPAETKRLANDLELDSLGVFDFTLSAEEQFDVEVTDDEIDHLTDVKSLVDLVHGKLVARGEAS